MKKAAVFWVAVFAVMVATAVGEVRLPAIWSDHAVVQAGREFPVWGWADAGEPVSVSIGGKEATALADGAGKWQVQFGALEAGKKYTLEVRGKNQLRVEDILAGEVWLCSGQSNMEWPVEKSADPEKEAAAADFPEIRFFDVKNSAKREAQEDVAGAWQVCSPEVAAKSSAVAYYFGRELFREKKTPVGLVVSAWGGTPGEAWTSLEALEAEEDLLPIVARYEQGLKDEPQLRKQYDAAAASWKLHLEEWIDGGAYEDPGNRAVFKGWGDPGFDDGGWEKTNMPMSFSRMGLKIDGAVWFRKGAEVPAAWEGRDLILHLGTIDDYDVAYWCGKKVGSTGKETPNFWTVERAYRIPGELVKAGDALIAVRVFDKSGDGGFMDSANTLFLALAEPAPGEKKKIPLAGEWAYAVEHRFEEPQFKPYRGTLQWLRGGDHEHAPGNLYNAMIAPIEKYPVAGVLWYQGENNVGRAKQYAVVLKALIGLWRQKREQLGQKAEMPFLIVQLANYGAQKKRPSEASLAELRESQSRLLEMKGVGLATAADLGEEDNIHPKNKQAVGFRLAREALARVYGKKVAHQGPSVKGVDFVKGEAKVHFRAEGKEDGKLVVKGGKVKGFALAGEDKEFHWAEGRVEGNTVILSSPEVTKPVAVRYAWAASPEMTIYNEAGFPALPFRTDSWQGLTDSAR